MLMPDQQHMPIDIVAGNSTIIGCLAMHLCHVVSLLLVSCAIDFRGTPLPHLYGSALVILVYDTSNRIGGAVFPRIVSSNIMVIPAAANRSGFQWVYWEHDQLQLAATYSNCSSACVLTGPSC